MAVALILVHLIAAAELIILFDAPDLGQFCALFEIFIKKYLILSKKDAALPMPAPRNAQAMVAIAPLNIMGAVKAHLIIIKIAQGVD